MPFSIFSVPDLNGVSYPMTFQSGKRFMVTFVAGQNQLIEVGHSQLDLILKKLSIKVDYTWAVRHPLHSSF